MIFVTIQLKNVVKWPDFSWASVAILLIRLPKDLADKLAKGIIIMEISESFQFWVNITVSRPIKVKESLNKVKIALLNNAVMWLTS